MWTYHYNDELYHWGVKGQKWGVRRYQNADGTLTPAGKKRYAKDLYRDVERAAKNSNGGVDETATAIKSKVKSHLTDADIANVREKHRKFIELSKVEQANEELLDKYARETGQKIYDDEMKRNGDAYPTERDRNRLWEYSVFEGGYEQAYKDHPEIKKAEDAATEAFREYSHATTAIAQRLLGNYGKTPIKNLQSSYWGKGKTLEGVVADAISELERDNWKAANK